MKNIRASIIAFCVGTIVMFEMSLKPRQQIQMHERWLGRELFAGMKMFYYISPILMFPFYLLANGLLIATLITFR